MSRKPPRDLLKERAMIGTWSVLTDPQVHEVLIQGGLDFTIIDMEHGPSSFSDAKSIVMAVQGQGGYSFLRVPKVDESYLLRALELGINGVVVPQIWSARQANEVVEMIYYHPRGRRGFSPYTRSAGYHPKLSGASTKDFGTRFISVLLVEGEQGFEDLEAICKIEGVDVVYFGTYDLSFALGVPGEVSSSKVQEFIKSGVEVIKKHKKMAGILCQTREELVERKGMGFDLLCYQADCSILREGLNSIKGFTP